jgi:uncharacterized protein YbjT (DUF2867 family)
MYVVTGATSNTGTAVATSLLDRAAPVRVVGRSRERLEAFVRRGAEPIVSEPSDQASLARAFDSAKAAYVMLQPGYIPDSNDFLAYQLEVIDAIASAIVEKRVIRVVALSGWGANYDKVSSPLDGLRVLEARLQAIRGLKTLALRPGWFMENATGLIHEIANKGTASGQLRGDLALPMIATADIGEVAADLLIKGEFIDYSFREVEGPEALSLNDAAAIIGNLTGRPDAVYRQIPTEESRNQLLSRGFSTQMADAIVQMTEDVNAGRIHMAQPREKRIITHTRFQCFVKSVLGNSRVSGAKG